MILNSILFKVYYNYLYLSRYTTFVLDIVVKRIQKLTKMNGRLLRRHAFVLKRAYGIKPMLS